MLVTATRWAIEETARAITVVDRLDSAIAGDEVHARVDVAVDVLTREPLASARPAAPSRADLVALQSAGRPWGSVAGVAEWLRVLDHDPLRLAELPIDPDPAFADRLFHVAVLGLLLRGLRAANGLSTSSGCLAAGEPDLKFRVTDLHGAPWDLWYEASGIWTHYRVKSPFTAAVAGISGTGGPLGADLALVRSGDRAVVIEVKYSDKPTYVGRNGYEQCLAYMAEALTGLVNAVVGVVVGPAEIVTQVGRRPPLSAEWWSRTPPRSSTWLPRRSSMPNPPASSPDALTRMRRQARRDTRPEVELRRLLFRRGLRYHVHRTVLSGSRRRHDIVFPTQRVVVEVLGCYWHGCPIHGTKPKANAEWWAQKLSANVARDHDTAAKLTAAGWTLVTVWEHDSPADAADRIESLVRGHVVDP